MRHEKSPHNLNGGPCESTARGYHIKESNARIRSFDYKIGCCLDWLNKHRDNELVHNAVLLALGQTLIDYLGNREGI